MIPTRLALALLVLTSGSAQADWLLSSTEPRVISGKPFTVSVFSDEAAAHGGLPDTLTADLESGRKTVPLRLTAVGQSSAGGMRRDYEAEWPVGLIGAATLVLPGKSSSRLMLVADEKAWAPGEDPVARMSGAPYGTTETPRGNAFAYHEPMYFLVGANGGANARFQLSFKYRLFDREGVVAQALPVIGGLYFGYTQTSLWDLSTGSAPFRDTSYRPSLFYQWDIAQRPGNDDRWMVQAGVEHESNGKDGANSRSLNTAFARLDWRTPVGEDGAYFGVMPKIWTYLEKDDNPDIQRYRGHGEVALRYGRDEGWVSQVTLRRGTAGRGSTQVDVSRPLGTRILSDAGAFLHFQYFDGYGETLLDYDQVRHPQFRVGLSIVR
ncbi:MAG: phospholipase A [Zoogloeaceae bacterium]|nr:phospholipase A [Zoogloeaceae bacterium]